MMMNRAMEPSAANRSPKFRRKLPGKNCARFAAAKATRHTIAKDAVCDDGGTSMVMPILITITARLISLFCKALFLIGPQ